MTTNIERANDKETAPPTPKAKRRWFAFSLRTLLIATTLLSCVLGYFGNILLRVRHQRAVIAKIEAAGASIRLGYPCEWQLQRPEALPEPDWVHWMVSDGDFAVPVAVMTTVFPEDPDLKDEDLPALLEFPTIHEIALTGEQVTNRGIETISQLPNLRDLRLFATGVTGDGLKKLAVLPKLQNLYVCGGNDHDDLLNGISNLEHLTDLTLDESSVTSNGLLHLQSLDKLKWLSISEAHHLTDDGLSHLEKLQSLEVLGITNSPVTDEGIAHLANCENLTALALTGTEITDSGVVSITKLKNLRQLFLTRTSITDEGIALLKQLKHLEILEIGPGISEEVIRAFEHEHPSCWVECVDADGQKMLFP